MFKARLGDAQPGRGPARASAAAIAPGKRTLTMDLPAMASGGKPLPTAVRRKMEASLGADFSAVRIHEGPQAAAIGAAAYTQGSNIFFAPGRYDPDSADGQELLGHELAHVVQQAQGRAGAGPHAKGGTIDADPGLEREADAHGAQAARGQPATGHAGGLAIASIPHGAIQRKAVGEMAGFFANAEHELGIQTEHDYASKCAAGFVAHATAKEVSDAVPASEVLGATEWQTVDIADPLPGLIEQFPAHYLPTNVKVWKDLFDRIDQKRGKLAVPKQGDIDLAPPSNPAHEHLDSGGTLEAKRTGIVGGIEGNMAGARNAALTGPEQQLATKIKQAKITMNIPLDKLFNLRSPRILNGFEVKEKLNVDSPNIVGELAQQRVEAEHQMFGLPEEAIAGRIRPRYAALNFKNHPTGAAARNDYGLSYFVLSDALKAKCTVTIGDTFDRPSADAWGKAVSYGSVFTLSEAGINAMVKTIFALKQAGNSEMDSLINGADYKPNDNYFDVQIHDDVDVRTSGEQIWISRLEMAMFNVPEPTVIKLVDRITGGTYKLVD
jgi:hypothetical protein